MVSGGAIPHSPASVGYRSIDSTSESVAAPALAIPGVRIIITLRRAHSYFVCLPQCQP